MEGQAEPTTRKRFKALHTLVCQICGKKFKSENRGKRVCDRPECRAKRARKHYLAFCERQGKSFRALNIVRTCPYCGKEFSPKREEQQTCGAAECIKKRYKELAAIRRQEIKAGIRKPNPQKFDKGLRRGIDQKITRNCLKCGRPFQTDVNWLCDSCHGINAGIYMF